MIKEWLTENLIQAEGTQVAGLFAGITYPWEALPLIGDFIRELGPGLAAVDYQQLAPDIWIAKSAVVAPTASLNGPLIIGPRSEIRHCAFIRGNAYIGPDCVVGNSTEVKNSVLIHHVQVPHYNYVGDSILGAYSHMGAGSITSNVKSDQTLIVLRHGENSLPTNLKKFGAILGDHVEVGCNSVLNPGSIIGRYSRLYPVSAIRGYVPPHSIYKADGMIVPIHENQQTAD